MQDEKQVFQVQRSRFNVQRAKYRLRSTSVSSRRKCVFADVGFQGVFSPSPSVPLRILYAVKCSVPRAQAAKTPASSFAVGGVLCASAIPKHTPPLITPRHGDPPVPSEGEGASAFPPRTPPWRGRRKKVLWLPPTFKLTAPAFVARCGQLHSRLKCSPSGRSTPENTSGVFVPP